MSTSAIAIAPRPKIFYTYVHFNKKTHRARLQSTTPHQLQCYTHRRSSNSIPIQNLCIHDSSSFYSIGQYCAGGGFGLSIMLRLIHFFSFLFGHMLHFTGRDLLSTDLQFSDAYLLMAITLLLDVWQIHGKFEPNNANLH